MKPTNLYHYKAYVTRVYSGDSCIVDIDLGLDIWTRGLEIKFNRIQVPTNKGNDKPTANMARDFLRSLILDREVLVRTSKERKGKPSRILVEMVVVTEDGKIVNVNEALVDAGHAVIAKADPT